MNFERMRVNVHALNATAAVAGDIANSTTDHALIDSPIRQ